jgi:hypothetical protein
MGSGKKIAWFMVKWLVIPIGFLLVGFYFIGPRIGGPVSPNLSARTAEPESPQRDSREVESRSTKRREPIVEISAKELSAADRERLRRENAPRVAPVDNSQPVKSSTRRPPPSRDEMVTDDAPDIPSDAPYDDGGSAGGAGLTSGDDGGSGGGQASTDG